MHNTACHIMLLTLCIVPWLRVLISSSENWITRRVDLFAGRFASMRWILSPTAMKMWCSGHFNDILCIIWWPAHQYIKMVHRKKHNEMVTELTYIRTGSYCFLLFHWLWTFRFYKIRDTEVYNQPYRWVMIKLFLQCADTRKNLHLITAPEQSFTSQNFLQMVTLILTSIIKVTQEQQQQWNCKVITRTVTCYSAMPSTEVLLHRCGRNVTFHSTAMAALLPPSPAAKRTPLPSTTSTWIRTWKQHPCCVTPTLQDMSETTASQGWSTKWIVSVTQPRQYLAYSSAN